jgi:AraC-like DNA-binding protein
MRSPRSRGEASALSALYAERDPGIGPGPDYIGYFCPTAKPVMLLVTDHHAPGQTSLIHSHPCIAFHGCLHGPITLLLEGGAATLDAGTLYLFAPGVRHHWRNDGPNHAVMLSFLIDAGHPGAWPAASGIAAACPELTQRVRGAVRFEARGQVPWQAAFWELADCLQPDQPREPALVTGLLWALIGQLTACLRSTGEGAEDRLDAARRMQRLLVQRVQDRLSVAEIARHVHLSSSRAKEVFHGAFGCGIMSYFNQLKIQQAKRLLCDGSLTIKQVSKRLGFSSASYFDQVFYRHTGLRPSQFRNG